MAYNTGNPLGSTDARDLADNAYNFDTAVNSTDEAWIDRLGVTRTTFEGAIAGMSFFNVGTFAVGYTLTNSRQTLTYAGGEYSWSGAFPKIVVAGSSPTPLGSGGWIDRSDASLRSELQGGDGSLVGFKLSAVGSVLRSAYDIGAEVCSVKHFGALGDGSGDALSTRYATLAEAQAVYPFVSSLTMPIDTAAIIACWNYVTSNSVLYYASDPVIEGSVPWRSINGPQMFFPAGQYIWEGIGNELNLNDGVNQFPVVSMRGESSQSTEIHITDDSYIIDSTAPAYGLEFLGLKVVGGLGAIKFPAITQNQAKLTRIEGCFFSGYRECAIGFGSQDWPNIKIKDNQFAGKSGFNHTAIAISGLSANSEISGNEFIISEGGPGYVYAMKLAVAENDSASYYGPSTPILVADNSMYRGNTGASSVGVWIVPNPDTSNNAGRALTLRGNKFGAENYGNNDFHVLIADEEALTGDWVGNKQHAASASTGYLRSVLFDKNNVRFEPNHTKPYIASYTPNLQHIVVDDIVDNCLPVYMLEYLGSTSYLVMTGENRDNIVYTRNWNVAADVDYSGKPVANVSNVPSAVVVVDEQRYINSLAVENRTSAASVAFTNLMTVDGAYNGSVNSCTKSPINNSLGMSNEAAELIYSANFGRITWPLTGAISDRIIWLEIELKKSVTNPLDFVTLELIDANGTTSYFKRPIAITDEWKMYVVPVNAPAGFTGLNYRLVGSGYSAGTKEQVRVGRVNAYQAAEAINTGHARTINSTWDRQHLLVGSNHMWFDSFNMLRWKPSAPTSAGDGTAFGQKVGTPANATSVGYPGQWAADSSYFYVYIGDGTTHSWVRAAVAAW